MTQKIKMSRINQKKVKGRNSQRKRQSGKELENITTTKKSSDLKKNLINDENLVKRKGKKYIYKKWENETKRGN